MNCMVSVDCDKSSVSARRMILCFRKMQIGDKKYG